MTNYLPDGVDRRQFLAATGALGVAGLAGCTGDDTDGGSGNSSDGGDGGDGGDGSIGQIGSGREGRGAPGGIPMAEMPDLEGELTVYSGRGEFLVGELVEYIEDQYDDFDLTVRYAGSTDLVNQILNEGDGSPPTCSTRSTRARWARSPARAVPKRSPRKSPTWFGRSSAPSSGSARRDAPGPFRTTPESSPTTTSPTTSWRTRRSSPGVSAGRLPTAPVRRSSPRCDSSRGGGGAGVAGVRGGGRNQQLSRRVRRLSGDR